MSCIIWRQLFHTRLCFWSGMFNIYILDSNLGNSDLNRIGSPLNNIYSEFISDELPKIQSENRDIKIENLGIWLSAQSLQFQIDL